MAKTGSLANPLASAIKNKASLSVVPMYWFARAALGERAGVIATLIYTLIPSIVIFTATSADITFMP